MNARGSYSFQRFPYGACPALSRGNPKISLWLSVDPLAEKYPSVSPFAYTYGNPVRFVDPTGMEGEAWDDIIINVVDKEGNKKEIFRAVTDKFDVSVDIKEEDLPVSAETLGYHQMNLDEKMKDLGPYLSDNIQAFSVDFSGSFKIYGIAGGQVDLSFLIIVDGINKGDFGIYFQPNVTAGVSSSPGSLSMSYSLYWPTHNNSSLKLKDFTKWERGIQASYNNLSIRILKGFEMNWSLQSSYSGISVGTTTEKAGANGYLGYSWLLYEHYQPYRHMSYGY